MSADKPSREFAEFLLTIYSYYGQEDRFTEPTVLLWWQALRDAPMDLVRRGFSLHMADPLAGRWIPKIADIIGLIDVTPEERADLAWSIAAKAKGSCSPWDSVRFEDPIITACIALDGGWVKFTRTQYNDFAVSRWKQRYIGFYRRKLDLPDLPDHLPGIEEMQAPKSQRARIRVHVVRSHNPLSKAGSDRALAQHR